MDQKQDGDILIIPYGRIVGQEDLKLGLELTYIAGPRLGGVLLSGQRGTGKSTIVRAFAKMIFGELPVTLPLNATEDRVIGGYDVHKLMVDQKPVWRWGLLKEAGKKGLLYIDEVNLLDDHIINLILDAAATGVLVAQREGASETTETRFALVGTMNPEEGALRPQLLDRFGLLINVSAVNDLRQRAQIVREVIAFDEAKELWRRPGAPGWQEPKYFADSRPVDEAKQRQLKKASESLGKVQLPEQIVKCCVALAEKFQVEGHRGDYVMALAARAYAARAYRAEVTIDDVRRVAPLALRHRRRSAFQGDPAAWTEKDDQDMNEFLERWKSL